MKTRLIIILLMALSTLFALDSSARNARNRMVIISDVHLLSPELITPGSAIDRADVVLMVINAFEGIASVNAVLNSIYDNVNAMARAAGAVKAYATGGLVDYTGLASVHGTPGKPELMLNASDTERFLEAAQILRENQLQAALSRKIDTGFIGDCPFYKTAEQRRSEHVQSVKHLEAIGRHDLVVKYGQEDNQPRVWGEIW